MLIAVSKQIGYKVTRLIIFFLNLCDYKNILFKNVFKVEYLYFVEIKLN